MTTFFRRRALIVMGSLTSKCLAALPIVVCQSRGVHRRMGDCPTEKAGFSTFGNSIVIVRRELGGGKLSLRTRVCEEPKGDHEGQTLPLCHLRASLRLFLER